MTPLTPLTTTPRRRSYSTKAFCGCSTDGMLCRSRAGYCILHEDMTPVATLSSFVVGLVIAAVRCEARLCYECFHCNKILRTWDTVNCNGSCVTKQITHKFVEPAKASAILLRTSRMLHYYRRSITPHSFIPGLKPSFLQILPTAAFPFLPQDSMHGFPYFPRRAYSVFPF